MARAFLFVRKVLLWEGRPPDVHLPGKGQGRAGEVDGHQRVTCGVTLSFTLGLGRGAASFALAGGRAVWT